MRHIERAHAKLNLLLAVQPCIVDGKHLLTSVFLNIGLHDTLTFDFEAGSSLSSEAVSYEFVTALQVGIFDCALENNMVVKAVRLFLETFGAKAIPAKQLHILLDKQIPLQAGLGGGSSDAAAVLRMLTRLANMQPTMPALIKLAQRLGADVPFFLHGGCAHMGGFGDELIECLPVPQLDLVLVKPAQGISTKELYQSFDRDFGARSTPIPDSAPLVAALREGSSRQVLSDAMANNLEPAAIKLLNEIAIIKQELEEAPGVLRALVTGSGSTVFGVCENAATAQQVAKDMADQGYWSCVTSSINSEVS